MRLPRLTEHRPFRDMEDPRQSRVCGVRNGVPSARHEAGTRYGSKASTETVKRGSVSAPHSSVPLKQTV